VAPTSPPPSLPGALDPSELRARVLALAEPADRALEETLKSHVPYIEQVSRYIIFSGGKRLRPVLYLLAAAAAGGQGQARHAAIFEYLHAATLLHDDVIDEAGLRRGRPAARTKYGNDAVILVGDFLFSKSYSLAAEVADHRFVTALTDCTTIMAEGQVLELLFTGDFDLSEDDYRRIIESKTAVLIAAACQMGAIFAGASNEAVAAFYDYGLDLGMAFQMVDDALDYVGTEHEFGKPVGHDLAEGKITLPFIFARENWPPPRPPIPRPRPRPRSWCAKRAGWPTPLSAPGTTPPPPKRPWSPYWARASLPPTWRPCWPWLPTWCSAAPRPGFFGKFSASYRKKPPTPSWGHDRIILI